MTFEDLPPPDTKRWVASRKAAVVAAVRQGLLSSEQACRRYELSVEEFEGWRIALDEHGIGALRTTRLQLYRE
jgi:transposase-like protein